MKATVVIIDDDIDTLDCLRFVLQRQSYAVLCATTGAEGVDLARQHRAQIVVTDLSMPDMDGFEVCRRLRAEPDLAQAAVMLLSGREASDDGAAALAAGVDRYVVKPVTMGSFVAMVDDLLAHPAQVGARIERGQA